jgi:hypothetical protein
MAVQVVVARLLAQILVVLAVLAHRDKVIMEDQDQLLHRTMAVGAGVVLALLAVTEIPQQEE